MAIGNILMRWAAEEADELYSQEDILQNALFALIAHASRSEFKDVRPDMVEKLLEYKFYGVQQPISQIENPAARKAALNFITKRHCEIKFRNDMERRCLDLLLVWELGGVDRPICKMTKEEVIHAIESFYEDCDIETFQSINSKLKFMSSR